ncbi:MAG TPA: NFACT RNA binding domain-containing protein [Ohtaekwangia sp.]|nr:NFACT RNA binding domain-containing protein [Ohtaekwangia sp.]
MHNNYYFLKQLSHALEKELSGAVVSECFSQNRNELIVRFEVHVNSHFIRASLVPSFSCLSFPEDFARARKNSVDLFPSIIGRRVTGIRQFTNERSFAIDLSDGFSLLFKLHGNRSNIIVFENETCVALFKNNMPADAALRRSDLDRAIDWSFETFIQHKDKLSSLYFTFGKPVWKYLSEDNFDNLSPEQQWQRIQALKTTLEQPVRYYILSTEKSLILSLVPVGEIRKTFSDPVAAINEFYSAYVQHQAFEQEQSATLAALRAKIESSETYLKKTQAKLDEIGSANNYKVWADLIMANMHAITPGSDKVVVANFYNHYLPLEIRLKKDLSPQKNASVYYRKAKHQHIEIDRLNEILAHKAQEVNQLKAQLLAVSLAADLKDLRQQIKSAGLPRKDSAQLPALPYHEFERNGFRVWVGKNAASNDALTLHYAYKEDLWLHAKDVPGSHVIIKYQSGRPFPKDVIERAAQLAAYYSKRKNESLCPVTVTPKKFVRKRKGDPAGAVIVEREDVILVEPKAP